MGVDKPNYTQIPNLILDDLMRYMDGAELKVTLAIARQTFGYHRERIRLTISDIEGLTGLSRPAVTGAIDVGIRRGLIARNQEEGGKYTYSIVINDEVLVASKETLPPKKGQGGKESLPSAVKKVNQRSKETLPPTVNKVDQDGKEILPISVKEVDRLTPVLKKEKENLKERDEDKDPPPPLSRAGQANEEEEEAKGLDGWAAVSDVWSEHFGEMPDRVEAQLRGLVAERGSEAVSHGIEAAARAGSRNYRYIAECARNYIPPAQGKRYDQHIDLPGVHVLPPATNGHTQPLAPPLAHDDPWAVCLAELSHALPGVAASYLTGSRLADAGTVDGVPLYRIVLEGRAAAGVQWLTHQAGAALRRKLGSILGRPVLIEIVAEEQKEEEPAA